MLDVAIIGAGAAGLGAAKTALSKGLSFKVLEAAPFIGVNPQIRIQIGSC